MKKLLKKKKTALVLGGGGARGIAHLGIIKFLEENGYNFDFIVGTSAGGVFGSFYLKYKDVDRAWQELKKEVYEKEDVIEHLSKVTYNSEKMSLIANFREKIYAAKVLFKEGVLEEKFMREPYEIMFKGINNIEELNGKIYMVAIDLLTGQDIVFSKGELLPALMATSALPGIFPPVNYKGYYLIDGGSTQKLPTIIARKLGADRILAVDVGTNLDKKVKKHPTGVKIMIRVEDIVSYRLHEINIKFSDLYIRPEIEKFKWFEFDKYEEIFKIGYNAARQKASEIEDFFNSRKTKYFPFEFFEDFVLI